MQAIFPDCRFIKFWFYFTLEFKNIYNIRFTVVSLLSVTLKMHSISLDFTLKQQKCGLLFLEFSAEFDDLNLNF